MMIKLGSDATTPEAVLSADGTRQSAAYGWVVAWRHPELLGHPNVYWTYVQHPRYYRGTELVPVMCCGASGYIMSREQVDDLLADPDLTPDVRWLLVRYRDEIMPHREGVIHVDAWLDERPGWANF